MEKLKLKIKVLSCVKNCSLSIEESFHHIKEFQNLFESVEVIIAENDSKDNSFELLKTYSKGIDAQILNFNGADSLFPRRTHRLAYLHNKLLEQSRDSDYIFVIDFDSILKNFDIEGVKNSFDKDLNSWDVITANCNNRYYDIWTLRNEKVNYDCWDLINHKRQLGLIDEILIPMYVGANQIKIKKENKLIPVNSAFGGFGIYKTKSIENCFYDGRLLNCECSTVKKSTSCLKEMCQHVNLHKQAREKNKAKIFINTDLIVNCQTEHLR